MNGLVGQTLLTRHVQEPVVNGIGIFQRAACAVHGGVVVFRQSHSQCGHGGDRSGHADDGVGLAGGNDLERLVDMRVDIRDRLGDLPLGRRVVFQMTLRHTDRPDIHGERGLHLRARMGDAVASQHQFGGTSAQIDHQIGGLDLAMDDAGGTKEA